MDELLQGGRPGDYRNFIHKKLLGVVGAIGIPGISAGARIARSFLGGGSRSRGFLDARAIQTARIRREARKAAAKNLTVLGAGATPLGSGAIAIQSGGPQAQRNGECPPSGSCCKPEGGSGHTNKTGYYVQSVPGDPAQGGTWIEKGARCVSSRRRNFFNGRSNSKALTRLTGWARNTKRLRKAVKALEVASR